MSLLATELNNHIATLKNYHRSLKGWRRLPLLKSNELDLEFLSELEKKLTYHIVGDDEFSEKTLNDLYDLLSSYRGVQGISKKLNRLIVVSIGYVELLRDIRAKDSRLQLLEGSVHPLELRQQNLESQVRLMIRESMRLRESNAAHKASEKEWRRQNATLKLKVDALEQEARNLRLENSRLNRLMRSFRVLLLSALRQFSPEAVEPFNQLILFRDNSEAFEAVLREIETKLRKAKVTERDKQEDKLTVEAQKETTVLDELQSVWGAISKCSEENPQLLPSVISMLRSKLHNQPGGELNLKNAHEGGRMIERRYNTLKEKLYQAQKSKPFFSTSELLKRVSPELLKLSEKDTERFVTVIGENDPTYSKQLMLDLLDRYFSLLNQYLNEAPAKQLQSQLSHADTLHRLGGETAVVVEEDEIEPAPKVLAAPAA